MKRERANVTGVGGIMSIRSSVGRMARNIITPPLLILLLLALVVLFAPSASAATPVNLKATVEIGNINAIADGEYNVQIKASSLTSRPPPQSKVLKLKKGAPLKYSAEFSFNETEFDWELTVSSSKPGDSASRPLILGGRIPQLTILEAARTGGGSNTKPLPYPYVKAQPATPELQMGEPVVVIKLRVFTASLVTCSQLPKDYLNDKYVINLWMDGNGNNQKEPGEIATAELTADSGGKICAKSVPLASFVERVNFEYELIDPKGNKTAPAKGAYDFKSKNMTGLELPEAGLGSSSVAFSSVSEELVITLSNPFVARLEVVTEQDPLAGGAALCRNESGYDCPVIPKEMLQWDYPPTPGVTQKKCQSGWCQWRGRFVQNKVYIPLGVLLVGGLALLVAAKPRSRSGIG
jgi:hypothetical protein